MTDHRRRVIDKPHYSQDYVNAFKKQRFSAMKFPEIAAMLYKFTSNFAVHGETDNRLATSTIETTFLTCKFYNRPEIESESFKQQLETLIQGHQLLCAEYLNLCLNYGFQCDKIKQIAEFLIAMLPING